MHYDAELHFVHNLSSSKYLVIGVFFDILDGELADSWFLEDLELEWINSIEATAEHEYFIKGLDVRNFFMKFHNSSFFNYEGSLTTPPCSEIVEWVVMKEPIFISP